MSGEFLKIWSSTWPAGVRSRLPSGEKVRRRKKRVALSSAYSLCIILALAGGGALIAGNGGIGEGERPRPRLVTLRAGDAACCEENDDRREVEPLWAEPGGGGFMLLVLGVEGTEIEVGVAGG
jgi:hypothetical protein